MLEENDVCRPGQTGHKHVDGVKLATLGSSKEQDFGSQVNEKVDANNEHQEFTEESEGHGSLQVRVDVFVELNVVLGLNDVHSVGIPDNVDGLEHVSGLDGFQSLSGHRKRHILHHTASAEVGDTDNDRLVTLLETFPENGIRFGERELDVDGAFHCEVNRW